MDERRQSERIPVNLDAKITSGGRIFDGSIENMSEDGMEYYMTSYVSATKDYFTKKSVDISFRSPSGEKINLHCELKWLLETFPEQKSLLLGMRIIDPPLSLRELLKRMD